ncbi:hypothetical protein [Patulibacter sp. SYSU D01012]|uniref:hypothetical protein n=1 Tax=Patulibacter sp. SYSU D01012 TaxID=2817381 RepID=UPI001B315A4B|nr:hypothetical protein [Patulibacter sp. SYSU D01012]
MTLLAAATSASTYTFWLLFLWVVIIPLFAVVPIWFAIAQTRGEHRENLAYQRGERVDANDADVPVVDA